MLNEFKQYLLGIGKSENTALNYCDKVKLYFKWCRDSFGSEPQQLYRANVLDYISYCCVHYECNKKEVFAVPHYFRRGFWSDEAFNDVA